MTLHDPKCIKTRILAFLPKIIYEIYSAYDMNTQTPRTLRTVSFITICLPFGGIKPVCHDRHKTVPEFIVILCNQMWMTTTEVRLLMLSSFALFANQGRFDFGTFNFRQLF